jgi:monothiol glutaredoxin
MMDSKVQFQFFDVRTPEEQEKATLGARLLDAEAMRDIEALDRSVALVFHCHHGMRSQSAAERFLRAGFQEVYNLAGGIDAWSQQVDPKIPRY